MREVSVADIQDRAHTAEYVLCPNHADKERGIILYQKLLGRAFYKLFFHWCYGVRMLFHNIMLYQCRNWFESAYRSPAAAL